MKKVILNAFLWAFLFPLFIVAENLKVEPAFWWSSMKNPELQLMVYGKDIASYRPSVEYDGVHIKSTVILESPNYMLVYLDIANAQPGTFNLTFTNGKKKLYYSYELKARKPEAADIKGFDSSDVLYLIMPDRFANGDPSNDQIPMGKPYKVDRNDPNARHGGDLAGIEQHLDYIQDLGVTAIWLNPVLENDMEGGSYHGYSTTDYYRVDPRFGSNEDYSSLIEKTHQRGMKVVMDMIFNHCGSDHLWLTDIPSRDWFNNLDHYIQTNHNKEVYFDPYASDYDKATLVNGWFVPTMPDLNQKNPHVAKYLIQNSIWWIEYTGVDGIRQDTYPYADIDMMTDWCKEVLNEYPDYNIVGEAWMNYTIGSAYWQTGSKLNFGKDTHLKSVMDFRLLGIAGKSFHEETLWSGGLYNIFEHMCYDYVYPDINNVLRFLENHDTDRFLPDMPDNLSAFKQGIAFLLTIPGTPQLYYGQELLMHGSKEKGDGYIRLNVPGGWPDDPVNQFEASGRSSPIELPLNRYTEVLYGKTSGKDIITGRTISLDKTVHLKPKEVLILEM